MSEDRAIAPGPAASGPSGSAAPGAPGAPGVPGTPAAADPVGLRRARARHREFRRWVRILSPILIALILVAAIRSHPGPGATGRGLVVSLATAGVVAGLTGAVLCTMRPARRMGTAFGAVLLVSSCVLMWAETTGPGTASALIGVLFVVRILPVRAAVAISAAAFVVLATIAGVTGRGAGSIALLAVLAGFTGVSFLAGRLAQVNERAELLLAELEASRAAEARAAGLAERQRLAREMHDVLAHSLSGLMLKLEGARMLAARDPADPRLPPAIDDAHHLARSGLEEARRAIGALRGDQMPGPDRLAELADRFGEDRGIPCRLTVSGAEHRLGADTRLAVYRVAQEALTNIAKHARPDRVELRLAYEPGATRLTVEDFGAAGAAAADARGGRSSAGGNGNTAAGNSGGGGYGLAGMRERAELIGGTLSATPTPTGFRVELEVPE